MTLLKFPEPVSLAILQHVVNTVDIGVGWYIDCYQAAESHVHNYNPVLLFTVRVKRRFGEIPRSRCSLGTSILVGWSF